MEGTHGIGTSLEMWSSQDLKNLTSESWENLTVVMEPLIIERIDNDPKGVFFFFFCRHVKMYWSWILKINLELILKNGKNWIKFEDIQTMVYKYLSHRKLWKSTVKTLFVSKNNPCILLTVWFFRFLTFSTRFWFFSTFFIFSNHFTIFISYFVSSYVHSFSFSKCESVEITWMLANLVRYLNLSSYYSIRAMKILFNLLTPIKIGNFFSFLVILYKKFWPLLSHNAVDLDYGHTWGKCLSYCNEKRELVLTGIFINFFNFQTFFIFCLFLCATRDRVLRFDTIGNFL